MKGWTGLKAKAKGKSERQKTSADDADDADDADKYG